MGLRDKLGGVREESKVELDFSGFIDWMDGCNFHVENLHIYREHVELNEIMSSASCFLGLDQRYGGQLKWKKAKDRGVGSLHLRILLELISSTMHRF